MNTQRNTNHPNVTPAQAPQHASRRSFARQLIEHSQRTRQRMVIFAIAVGLASFVVNL